MALKVFTHDHNGNAEAFFRKVREIWDRKVREIWDNASRDIPGFPETKIGEDDMHDTENNKKVKDGQCFQVITDNNTHLIIAHMRHSIRDGQEAERLTQDKRLYFILLRGDVLQACPLQDKVVILPRDPQEVAGLDRFVKHLVEISQKERPEVNLRLLLPNPIPEATLAYKLVLLAQQKVNIQMPDGLKDLEKQVGKEFSDRGESWPEHWTEQEGGIEDKEDKIREDKIEQINALIEKSYGKKSE